MCEGIVGSGPGNISANRAGIGLHFPAVYRRLAAYSGAMDRTPSAIAASVLARVQAWACGHARALQRVRWNIALALCAVAMGVGVPPARAADDPLEQQVRQFTLAALRPAGHSNTETGTARRVEVVIGRLDPRLQLAPCARIEPYLPNGTRLWGAGRIGLRCASGEARWNVFLPITVKVYGQALVAAAPLAAGRLLGPNDVTQAEVDLAENPSAAVADAALVAGRVLAQPLQPGQSVRATHLRPRQWFAAGETVKVLALGTGFSIAGEGLALSPGIEGQPARVRTEGGLVLTGQPVAERQMELAL
jgi:flagella basal body P-ring formation protein FlgA